jgi:metallo-beta-lactamase family protein
MTCKLRFLGATRNVTGSKVLLEADGARVLVDCGMYQEWHLKKRNWRPFPVDPSSLDAVLLTHAHLDHCGLLPRLVADGFKGRIFGTHATAGIARIVLLDSARLQEEDADFKRRRHQGEGRKVQHPEVPLYTEDDVLQTVPLFAPVRYAETVEVADGIEATFFDAGHILGSSMIEVKVRRSGEARSIVFSGDIGRRDKPILHDPSSFDAADYVVMESTYGNRCHGDEGDIDEAFAQIIQSTRDVGGNLLIPAFAIGRSQELLYRLNTLQLEKRVPRLPVFVDSPMAIHVNEVFQANPQLFDEEMHAHLRSGESPFSFETLHMCRSVAESKAINHIRGSAIIIAGSGMCTGGRIKHHLVHNITRPESTVLFVGYQAAGTLGRTIADGATEIRILGQEHRVRARIAQIHGFSAHADRDELDAWVGTLRRPPRQVFVTHGDEEAAVAFAGFLHEKRGWTATAPTLDEVATLD